MEKESIKESLFEYIKVIIITVVVTLGILYFIQVSKVVGASMEPTYHNGNIILVINFFIKDQVLNIMILLLSSIM